MGRVGAAGVVQDLVDRAALPLLRHAPVRYWAESAFSAKCVRHFSSVRDVMIPGAENSVCLTRATLQGTHAPGLVLIIIVADFIKRLLIASEH